MSIATMLYKQSLIAQRNNLEFATMSGNRAKLGMLNNPSFTGNLEAINNFENAIDLSNVSNESQLMAINAQLQALNSAKGLNLNYLA